MGEGIASVADVRPKGYFDICARRLVPKMNRENQNIQDTGSYTILRPINLDVEWKPATDAYKLNIIAPWEAPKQISRSSDALKS